MSTPIGEHGDLLVSVRYGAIVVGQLRNGVFHEILLSPDDAQAVGTELCHLYNELKLPHPGSPA